MQQQNWFALEITAETDAAEAVEFALNELDALGTEINHLGKQKTATLNIVGYFNEQLADEKIAAQLDESLEIYGFPGETVKNFSWREVENQDWLAEWKKHWKPTESDKFIISPTWEIVANTDKIIIYIDPNMAFGTGTHATTQLCLNIIGEEYAAPMSFLDVGTGTGILTMAAVLKEGKRQKAKGKSSETGKPDRKSKTINSAVFLACDTDEDSIVIARENATLNEAADFIDFYVGSISGETQVFDFVCANLTIDVIVPILPLLIEKSRQILVLSGILSEQENIIVEELKKFGIENPKIETMGEWISVSVKK